MQKGPLILAVVGVVLVALLYSLPKVVVDDGDEVLDGGMATTETHDDDHDEEAIPDAHLRPMTEETVQIVAALRREVEKAEGTEKFSIFADSLADAYFEATWFDSAAHFADLVVEDNPGPDAWMQAGEYYYEAFTFAMDEATQARQAAKAREYLNKVVEVAPDNLRAKTKLAMTYVVTENPMAGILMLREVIEVDPNNILALFNLGMLSQQTGQTDLAAERFETLLNAEPDHHQARFFLGVTYQELGETDKAREAWEEILDRTDDPAIVQTVEDALDGLQ